jgi:prepilin-type N-terminal cleavage/methylation domain-containing protein
MNRRAFTLIEVLVTIGVISLLAALSLPAIAGARGASQRSKSLINLRSIHQSVCQYAAADKELYPAVVPGRTYALYCGATGGIAYWQTELQFPFLLGDWLPWHDNLGVYLSPSAQRDFKGVTSCGFPPSYFYSSSFVAGPRTWSGNATPDPVLLHGTSTFQVAASANKVIFWEWELPYTHRERRLDGVDIAESVPVMFADSHADQRVPALGSDPVPNPFPDSGHSYKRLSNTLNGVLGRDY